MNRELINRVINLQRTNLISKSYTTTKKDPANYKHGEVLGGSIEDDSDDEEETGDEHCELPAKATSSVGGKEGGSEPGQI